MSPGKNVKLHDTVVRDHRAITEDIHLLTLKAAVLAEQSAPGQFVQLRVSDGQDPLLRRPLSIHRVRPREGEIDLLYRVVGRGTERMSRAQKGAHFHLVGPLGRGFDLTGDFRTGIVVAGGMGSAPAFFLLDELLNQGKKVLFFWGVKQSGEFFGLEELKDRVDLHLASEDGEIGHPGKITEILEPSLNRDLKKPAAFVCGPVPMLVRVQTLALNTDFPWQVSLEAQMACGIGVCMGCGVRKRDGMKMVCSDGPVFDLKEVVFHG